MCERFPICGEVLVAVCVKGFLYVQEPGAAGHAARRRQRPRLLHGHTTGGAGSSSSAEGKYVNPNISVEEYVDMSIWKHQEDDLQIWKFY